MVAVFNVYFDFGGTDNNPGTEQNVDALGPPNIRWKTNDNATIDENDKIPIPASGTKRSYWKQIYLKCATAPSVQCDNFRFYTDGAGYGTGITLYVGDQFPTKNSGSNSGYDVATGTPGDTGDEMTDHSEITSKTNAFTYTVGSPLSGPSISEAGNIINAINETTDYFVTQMDVADTASPGNLTDETFTVKYDEV